MRIDVLTLFPEMCESVFSTSIMGRAREKGLLELEATNFRQFSTNKHSTVDDYPYGGGGGMVLKPEPIFAAVEHLHEKSRSERSPRVVLMCPQGETFTQAKAEELAKEEHLIFICGHYEGYDERIREHLVTDEMSIGDYVLTGGELPAMVIADAVARLLPGVLGNETSAVTDSFSTGLLEYPHYTRPAEFRGWSVPDVLISGHHANVDKWRREQSIRRTYARRPDLLQKVELTKADLNLLEQLRKEQERCEQEE